MAKLQASLRRPGTGLAANIRGPGAALDAELPGTLVITVERETYDGPYEITPKVESQTMATKGKSMAENVTIKSIPYFDVSNNAGGSTVYIGNEVE